MHKFVKIHFNIAPKIITQDSLKCSVKCKYTVKQLAAFISKVLCQLHYTFDGVDFEIRL